jgi:peptidoglycan hydrolase-like protein with peptidoglycan-binding domain
MNSGPQLAVGARGRDVQRVQTIFVMMKTLGFDQIDGVFGTLTRNAVVAFQESEGLAATASLATAPGSECPRTLTRPS